MRRKEEWREEREEKSRHKKKETKKGDEKIWEKKGKEKKKREEKKRKEKTSQRKKLYVTNARTYLSADTASKYPNSCLGFILPPISYSPSENNLCSRTPKYSNKLVEYSINSNRRNKMKEV